MPYFSILEIKKAKRNIAFQRARDWWSLYFLSILQMVIEKNELKSQIAGNIFFFCFLMSMKTVGGNGRNLTITARDCKSSKAKITTK